MSTSEPTNRKSPLWMRLLLVASLALNLLIIGVVAGTAFRHGPPARTAEGMRYAAPYIAALEQDDRRKIVGEIIRLRRNSGFDRRRTYREMLAQLKADPFDSDAVRAILVKQSDAATAVLQVSQQAWLEIVENMSPTERQSYALRVEEELQRRPRKKKDRK